MKDPRIPPSRSDTAQHTARVPMRVGHGSRARHVEIANARMPATPPPPGRPGRPCSVGPGRGPRGRLRYVILCYSHHEASTFSRGVNCQFRCRYKLRCAMTHGNRP